MKIFTYLSPKSSVKHSLARKALYSVWLLEVGKDKVRETSIRIPSSFSRMMLALLLAKLEASSTKIVHLCAPHVGEAGEVISSMKSASTWDLRFFLLLYLI